MAMVDDGLSVWPFPLPIYAGSLPAFMSGGSILLIDAADEAAGFVLRAPRSGPISHIGWGTRTVTTGTTVDVRLETVSGGLPSGTLKGVNSNGPQVVLDTDDNVGYLTPLNTPCQVTRGDQIAVVIKNPSIGFGNMQIASFGDDGSALIGHPHCVAYGGSWVKAASGAPILTLKYADAPVYAPTPGVWPVKSSITQHYLTTVSSPDAVGARFRSPIGRRIRGLWGWLDVDGDCVVKLVTADYHQLNGTGIVTSCPIATSDDAGSATYLMYFPFTESVVISANTWYRLIVEATTAGNVSLFDFDLYEQNALLAYGGLDFHLTTAKDPVGDGSWTNYDSGTPRVPFLWPVFDGVDNGGGIGRGPVLVGGGGIAGFL